jgi:hypothetical protein
MKQKKVGSLLIRQGDHNHCWGAIVEGEGISLFVPHAKPSDIVVLYQKPLSFQEKLRRGLLAFGMAMFRDIDTDENIDEIRQSIREAVEDVMEHPEHLDSYFQGEHVPQNTGNKNNGGGRR